MECLVVVPASKAACDQRAGRSGRVRAGKCFRLCTQEHYDLLPLASKPEILRSDLAQLFLQLKALGVRNLLDFDFLDRPQEETISR